MPRHGKQRVAITAALDRDRQTLNLRVATLDVAGLEHLAAESQR